MRNWAIGLLAVCIGMAALELVTAYRPAREPWDVREYWVYAYPAMIVVSAGLGFVAPVRAWRWGVAVTMGQCVWMLAKTSVHAGLPNLWPMTLVLFAILSLPCASAAAAGGWLNRTLQA